jgi:hypothetical protein
MSPRGAESFSKHKAVVQQRQDEAIAAQGPKADFFKLEANQFAVVRFLEQGTDIAWASMHRIPMEGRTYGQDVICLDQEDNGTPCPFCASEHKEIRARSTKGFYNVIWRGNAQFQQVNQQIMANNQQLVAAGQMPQPTYTLAPIYKRNAWNSPEKGPDNKPIILGYDDNIFLWKASKTVHDLIVSKDGVFGGLMSRDFTVRREGAGKDDTKYFIEPLHVDGGPSPLTDADQALITAPDPGGKYDLDKFISPPTYEQAAQLMNGVPNNGPQGTFNRGAGATFAPPPVPGMPPAPAQLQPGVPDPNAPTPFAHPAPASSIQGTFQQ